MKLSKIKLSVLFIFLGFFFLCVAAFIWALVAGFVALGIACLILSYLNED